MSCPRCGYVHPELPWQMSRKFENNSSGLKLPGLPQPLNITSAYRKTPVRKMELMADVVVPMAQATISGLMIGGLSTPLFAAAQNVPWYAGIYLGGISVGLVWVFRLATSRETLWVVEELTGADLDNDGHTGPPPSYGVRTELKTTDGWQFDNLPGQPPALHKFATAISSGESFTERNATAAGLSQPEWNALRDKFVANNWAYWRNPQRPQVGVELLRAGRAVLRSIAATPPPPPEYR
ncbi:MAG: hypothetical protein Kow0031_21940 [Anaerolineae bacterium]